MTTYRKKLLDKDGNTIIPAMAGDETGWVKTADLADDSVTSDKIDWDTVALRPGDTITVYDNFLGQMRNLSASDQGDISYVVVKLPREISTSVTTVSCTSFSLSEIDDLDFSATARTVSVVDGDGTNVSRTESYLDTTVSYPLAVNRYTISVRFKPKSGYSWRNGGSYHPVMLRTSQLTFSFS